MVSILVLCIAFSIL